MKNQNQKIQTALRAYTTTRQQFRLGRASINQLAQALSRLDRALATAK